MIEILATGYGTRTSRDVGALRQGCGSCIYNMETYMGSFPQDGENEQNLS